MTIPRALLFVPVLLTSCAAIGQEAGDEGRPTIAKFVDGMTSDDGMLDLHWDADEGRIYLELPGVGAEYLYATALASGLGSNPVGLDRGSLGPQHVVVFERHGPKVFLTAQNLTFRAITDNAREQLAVAESFAPSVLWSFEIVASTDERLLLDATEFFLRDAVDVAGRLQRARQRGYRLDGARSAIHTPRTKAFPDNTEVEATLTFAADEAQSEVSRTAAWGRAATLRVHHSFIRLPDAAYRPRSFDPRVGFFGVQFSDYAAPIEDSIERHWIARHRLVKKDPTAALSEPVEPLVYYLDPGTPEPVFSALKEGAEWWNEAFQAAGFKDAFRVEKLPADADPMDVRYNMIHWVHRATRGWSYGASIRDPRTGEILKGNVLLGSLRVRQDHMLFVGMDGPFDGCAAGSSPTANHLTADREQAKQLALARIRQLAAHEVGHTLGLSHNFAASTYGRASVMDYPAPLVTVGRDGKLDFTKSYDVGIGDYDKWAIRWGYSQFDGEQEAAGLAAIVADGLQSGYVFLTDQDARSATTVHPMASLWDNGSDPITSLGNAVEVRRVGLAAFGPSSLRDGATVATLEDVLVPLFLHHRFQLDAAMKVIGGVDYRHAVKGDGQPMPKVAGRQALAMTAILETLDVRFLNPLSDAQLDLPPKPPGHSFRAERFPRGTGMLTDRVAMAMVAAELTLDGLLEPHRLERVAGDVGRRSGLTLGPMLEMIVAKVGDASACRNESDRQVWRALQGRLVDRLIGVARSGRVSVIVRAQAEIALQAWIDLAAQSSPASLDAALVQSLLDRIANHRAHPGVDPVTEPTRDAPPGSPIGSGKRF